MFRKLAFAIAIFAVIPMESAMASGPTYAMLHASEPAIAANSGRIYMYRSSSLLGAALAPSIKVDDVVVGESWFGDYFYVDRPAGTYTISTTTEKEETTTVTLVAGQSVYVKFEASVGFFVGHVSPEVVPNDEAQSEIADCHFGKAAASAVPTAPAPATPAAVAPAAPAPVAAAAPATTPTETPSPAATQPAAPATPKS